MIMRICFTFYMVHYLNMQKETGFLTTLVVYYDIKRGGDANELRTRRMLFTCMLRKGSPKTTRTESISPIVLESS